MAKTCPSCGYHPIGPFTDNCPICAEPVRGGRSGRRSSGGEGLSPVVRWLLFAGLGAILSVAGCCGLGAWQGGRALRDAQQQMERARAEEEARRKARTIVVTAAQLLKEFQDDPEAAGRKYEGKYLEMSGVVERVGRKGNESHFVVLHGGDEQAKLRIECYFFPADEMEEARLDRLGKGDAVIIRGEYDGRVTNVQMRECELAK